MRGTLNVFYYKKYTSEKKNKKNEKKLIIEMQKYWDQNQGKESHIFKEGKKFIAWRCITHPLIENTKLESYSSISFIIKNDLLEEKIVNIFLKDTTGKEWSMPKKFYKKIIRLLLEDKIKISAKIVDKNNNVIKHRELFIFKINNNKPVVFLDPINRPLRSIYKGNAHTNEKGFISFYIYRNLLEENLKYTIGDGFVFISKDKLLHKKNKLYTFSRKIVLHKNEINIGKFKLKEFKIEKKEDNNG